MQLEYLHAAQLYWVDPLRSVSILLVVIQVEILTNSSPEPAARDTSSGS